MTAREAVLDPDAVSHPDAAPFVAVLHPEAGGSTPVVGADRFDRLTLEQRAEWERLFARRMDGIGALFSGGANVIMQLSWLEVAYGVMESKWERGAITRHSIKCTRTTFTFLSVALWGIPDQVRDFRAAVDTVHWVVRSGPDSPVRYNAFNRDLQLWVASCFYYGTRDFFVRMHGPLTAAEEELVLQAGVRLGICLQVFLDRWHIDVAVFEDYWVVGLRRVQLDDRMRVYLTGLLYFTFLPVPARWTLGRVAGWFNIGFLPPELREQMRFEWILRDERRHARLVRFVGRLGRLLPGPLRRFPFNAYLVDLDVCRWFRRRIV